MQCMACKSLQFPHYVPRTNSSSTCQRSASFLEHYEFLLNTNPSIYEPNITIIMAGVADGNAHTTYNTGNESGGKAKCCRLLWCVSCFASRYDVPMNESRLCDEHQSYTVGTSSRGYRSEQTETFLLVTFYRDVSCFPSRSTERQHIPCNGAETALFPASS